MEAENRRNLVINGMGASNGGQLNHVTINGKGTINSDLTCSTFVSNGSGRVKGNLISEEMKVTGSTAFKGEIKTQLLVVEGAATCSGHLHADELKVSGKLAVGGKVKCEEIHVQGILAIKDDCEAEVFDVQSRFNIGGLLNADQVIAKISGKCTAKEIGGQTITVKPYKKPLSGTLLKPFIKTQLEADLIEGDKIELENTIAKVVRGSQVRIGANCHIGVVEYTDEFTQSEAAVVNESKKL